MSKLKSFFDSYDSLQQKAKAKTRAPRKKRSKEYYKRKSERINRRFLRIEYRKAITARRCRRRIWHVLEREDDFLIGNFNFLRVIKYARRVARVCGKLRLKKRLLVIYVNSKLNKFEYRKRREERMFYRKLIRNLKICMTYPFIVKRYRGPVFFTKLPTQVVPVEPTDSMVRRRFVQPVFIRSVLKLCKPHNGLRKRSRRRL